MPTSPAPDLPSGFQVAPTGPRLLAGLVESGPVILLATVSLLFAFALDGRQAAAAASALLAVGWLLLVWSQRARRAAGPGMRLDSLQIVRITDGCPLGWGRVLLRGTVLAGLSITVVGGIALVIAMSRHPARRGWHDRAAGAVVIRERAKVAASSQRLIRTPSLTVVGAGAAADPGDRLLRGVRGPGVSGGIPTPAAASAGAAISAISVDLADPPESSFETLQMESIPGLSVDISPPLDQLPAVTTEWWLRLDDGREVGIDGLLLLGRNPHPRVGEEDATLVRLPDRARTVSKCHLSVASRGRGLVVMDRGSTNGTTVISPDGARWTCPPGDQIEIACGSHIYFGDRWAEVRHRDA